ncbi:MAG: AMP-binding protein, partial [Rhodothermaceae bacterium]|nr:AMP-binding protein [Rhodothermaceae bacterium]
MSAATIPCPVRRWADATPDAPALRAPERTWTWTDLDRRVTEMEAALRARCAPGSRLAVQAPNSPALVALVLAALRTGHVLALLSTRWPEAGVQDQLARIGCEELLDLAELRPPSSTAHRSLPIPLRRSATIIFTSGSTGDPKAALHTVGNHLASARGMIEAVALKAGDRWLLDLPLYHVGGLAIAYRCALAGATIVLPAPRTPTTEAVQRFEVTHASLVATQLYRLLQAEATPPAWLRVILLGGSAIPSGLLNDAQARGWPVHTSYGLTEMASTVTMTPAAASRAALATSGRVLPHRELAIRDGEIVVRG